MLLARESLMRFFPVLQLAVVGRRWKWLTWGGIGWGQKGPTGLGKKGPTGRGQKDTAFGGRRDPAAHPAASPPVCRDATPGAGCPSPNSEKWAQAASRAQSHSGGCLHVCVGVAAQFLPYSAGSLTPILLSPAFFSRSGSAGLQQRGSEHRLCPARCSPGAGLLDEALLQTPEQC